MQTTTMPDQQPAISLDDYTIILDVEFPSRVIAFRVAGIGSRILAGALDIMIVGAPVAGALAFLRVSHITTLTTGTSAAIAVAVYLTYLAVCESLSSQTPGKAIAGIRIVRTNGKPASVFQCLIRNLARIIDWLPLGYVIGLVSTLSSPLGQRLGDRIAGTTVVQGESLSQGLSAARIAPTSYSTSEDGYLLDSVVDRSAVLTDEATSTLSEIAAQYFHRQYPPQDPEMAALIRSAEYQKYLQRLYAHEADAAQPPSPE